MHKQLCTNLNKLMNDAQITSSELARQIGVPAATIKRIRTNEDANTTLATLMPIAKYFGISLSELVGDEVNLEHQMHKLPVYSWLDTKNWQRIRKKFPAAFIHTERMVSRAAFAIHIDCDHLPVFCRNSILIIDPKVKPQDGDMVVVSKKGANELVICQYIAEIDAAYLKSLKTSLAIMPLTEEFDIIGTIIQQKIELKKAED